MDLLQIQAFVELSNTKNMSDASKHLFVSQSSLSRRISGLEEELGFSLFDRTSHSVELTSQGKKLLPAAQSIVYDFFDFKKIACQIGKGYKGYVRVGFIGNARFWVPQIITLCKKEYPDIYFDISSISLNVLIPLLLDGKIDMAFSFVGINEWVSKEVKTLSSLNIGKVPLQVISSRDYPPLSSYSDTIPISALENVPIILIHHDISPSLYAKVKRTCELGGFSARIVMEQKNAEEVYTLVESGFGITFAPQNSFVNNTPNLRTYFLEPAANAYSTACILWKKDSTNPALNQIAGFLSDHYKSNT